MINNSTKLVVFDLDGTLFHGPLCFKALREKLSISPQTPILEYIDQLDDEEQQAEYHQQIRAIECAQAEQGRLDDEASPVLQALQARNIAIAVWTRNCREAVDISLRDYWQCFDHIETRDDSAAKPAPQGMYKIQAACQVQAAEILFVGDSKFDIEAGLATGVRTCILKHTISEAGQKAHPTIEFISSLRQILN